MAAMALQLRPKCIIFRNPSFVHLFSSSSDNNDGEDKKDSPSSPMSSYFNDVKASLRQSSSPYRRLSHGPPQDIPSFSLSKPTKVASLEEIRKNLSEFRSRSAPPLPDQKPSSSKSVSFQELYKRNVIEKGEDGSNTAASGGIGEGRKFSFDAIRESLRHLTGNQNQNQSDRFKGGPDRTNNKVLDPYSLKSFKESLKITPNDPGVISSNVVMGGSEMPSMFRKDSMSRSDAESQVSMSRSDAESQYSRNDLLKVYNYVELGEKLRKLRPVDTKVGKNWFSLTELNERLKKLREIEEKELESRNVGILFKDLRSSLLKLTFDTEGKSKKSSLQRLDILGHLGGTPNFMLAPPKEQLVEKFFHPDNMSSAEKLTLELKKVRDEFKMSESDCGSSRVQVAQLTTKIKHLSSVLHKKDKHSRKGLQEMVQRRKKLLRYLRRTDWDSYCFCLSKLGLRDNPDYKN